MLNQHGKVRTPEDAVSARVVRMGHGILVHTYKRQKRWPNIARKRNTARNIRRESTKPALNYEHDKRVNRPSRRVCVLPRMP